mmetsp:Transcript_39226/g.59840  ORF Transcript_39226/g.59840 Transcript_39226/m.59840 type:complete len:88 (+) Transcript_39226:5621-5884(+)
MNSFHNDLQSKLCNLISQSKRPQSHNSIARIIKAAITVIGWQESRLIGEQSIDDSARLCKFVFGHLMDLVHLNFNQKIKEIPQGQLE